MELHSTGCGVWCIFCLESIVPFVQRRWTSWVMMDFEMKWKEWRASYGNDGWVDTWLCLSLTILFQSVIFPSIYLSNVDWTNVLLLFKKYLDQLPIKSRFFYGVTWNSLSRITAYTVSILYCDVGICIVFYLTVGSCCLFT